MSHLKWNNITKDFAYIEGTLKDIGRHLSLKSEVVKGLFRHFDDHGEPKQFMRTRMFLESHRVGIVDRDRELFTAEYQRRNNRLVGRISYDDLVLILLHPVTDKGCAAVGREIIEVLMRKHFPTADRTERLAALLREMGVTSWPHSLPISNRFRRESWYEVVNDTGVTVLKQTQIDLVKNCPGSCRNLPALFKLDLSHNLLRQVWELMELWNTHVRQGDIANVFPCTDFVRRAIWLLVVAFVDFASTHGHNPYVIFKEFTRQLEGKQNGLRGVSLCRAP